MNRPTCISLESLRALGPETITRLSSALSIEAKAKASWESATAHVEQLFSEIALSCTAPVAEVPAIDAEPIVLKPRPQDRSQEVVMPLSQPFDVAAKVPSVMAVAEAEATTEGVTPCTSVVVEVAPEVVSLPPSGAAKTKKEEIWLPIREIAARLGVTPQRLGGGSRSWQCKDDGGTSVYRLSEATAHARAKGWLDEPTETKPAPVAPVGPAFEREGVAHYDAIEQGKRKAESEKWESFYITFDPKSGDVSYIRGRGQATGLNLVERWEKSRGGIWDSQPMGKGLDGAMGANMHTGRIGARVLA
jgi:hypothetical protein